MFSFSALTQTVLLNGLVKSNNIVFKSLLFLRIIYLCYLHFKAFMSCYPLKGLLYVILFLGYFKHTHRCLLWLLQLYYFPQIKNELRI